MSEIIFHKDGTNLDDKISLVELVPDDWLCISTELHAPLELIKNKKVAPKVIWRIQGKSLADKNLGYDRDSKSMIYCNLGKVTENKDNEKDFCLLYKNVGSIEAKVFELDETELLLGKGPCGIFLNHAGAFTGEKNLKHQKRLITSFIQKGYKLNYLDALSGVYLQSRGRKCAFSNAENFPSICHSPEYFRIDFNEHKAEVHWNPKLGGKEENINKIVQGLKRLRFEERFKHSEGPRID